MKYFIFSVLLISSLIFGCSKNSSPVTQTPSGSIKAYDVTQTRDSVDFTVKFMITLTPTASTTIKVDYTTVAGTAKADTDFVAQAGTITFAPGQNQAFVEVKVLGRKLKQSNQLFYLKLSNPVGAQLENTQATATLQNPGTYALVWSDEFNGTTLNTNDWNYETGGGGWGNNELQNYTSGTNNAYLENGNLVIEAKKETLGSSAYTSARLTTKGKRSFTYGKIEFRAKLPTTKGIWPALWMLGQNIDQAPWPSCGEIDIMELVNKETPSKVYGTGHWGVNSSSHLQSGGNYVLTSGYFSDAFHTFGVEWDADGIHWYVDGNKYFDLNKPAVTGGNFPFDKDFFIIMNVAVGGQWPGNPDATSVFPQKMYVDYVRVYQK